MAWRRRLCSSELSDSGKVKVSVLFLWTLPSGDGLFMYRKLFSCCRKPFCGVAVYLGGILFPNNVVDRSAYAKH